MNLTGGSWKTTATGLIGAIIAALTWAQANFDGNPATNVDLMATIAAVVTGIGLAFARDDNVTSEKAGAK